MKKRYTFYIEEDTYALLQHLANKDNRSKSQYLDLLISKIADKELKK